MEVTLHLVPGEGILPFRLGSSLEKVLDVAESLGLTPSTQDAGVVYFVDDAIHIEFIADATVFVGVSPHADLKLIFNHRDLLSRPASEVFDVFAAKEGGAHEFDDTEYVFENQIVTLWDADPHYDLKAGSHAMWGQIGVGNARYLQAISEY